IVEYEPKLVGAKINISKEETEGDSACCGAGNLDVGTEESLKETEGHCAWNAEELAALQLEMHQDHLEPVSPKSHLSFLSAEPVELKTKWEKKKSEADFENAEELLNSKNYVRSKTIQLKWSQRASFKEKKKSLECPGLKEDLMGKSANLRRLNEELPQAREETLNLNLKNKDLQRDF
ncbi:LOW QUALITY PROTEIN: coiled-coil domain-containing protein 160, partial [Eudromia elegans]